MPLQNLRDEIDAIMARDPAARSRLEVVLCYPGFHALLYYRAAHWLWEHGWRLSGRFVSHLGRMLTGIEIHPGARIGRRLFIDHGMGTVIGETTEIGDDCTLYHGVTLGGRAPQRGEFGQKRHPTLGNGVIVSSGAQVLGPFKVGDAARIAAAAVVLSEVPAGVTMVGAPARPIGSRRSEKPAVPTFEAYGIPAGGLPDPVARTLDGLLDECTKLHARVTALEGAAAGLEPAVEIAAAPGGGNGAAAKRRG